jgi:hypothetical protein
MNSSSRQTTHLMDVTRSNKMLIEFTKDVHQLAPGALISFQLKQAQVLQIAGGRVWLTIEGDARDHWLQAGASLILPAARLIVIEAEHAGTSLHLQKPQNSAFAADKFALTEETIG